MAPVASILLNKKQNLEAIIADSDLAITGVQLT